MAWRPYENLIDGELDNRTPGKVTGWLRFFRQGQSALKVKLDLEGDFHEDIREKVIRLKNDHPSDRNGQLNREGTYMKGIAAVQRGEVGDITAGLSLGPWTEELSKRLIAKIEAIWEQHGTSGQERKVQRRKLAEEHRQHIAAGDLYYPYVSYPYVEWYSEANGRVVLELDSSQVEFTSVEETRSRPEKTAAELATDEMKREAAFGAFFSKMVKDIAKEKRKRGGDGKVTGVVVR